MGKIRDLLHKQAEDWYFGPVRVNGHESGTPAPGPAHDGPETVDPETAYLALYLEAIHIRDARVGTQTFYGSVTSTCTLETRTGQRAELVTVTTPEALRGADPRHLDRVITSTTRLLDAVPYRGGGLDIEIGLFSLPANNLLGPYLEFLSDVATAATIAYLPPAAGLIVPLRKGIDGLFGTAEARLEIGLAHTWPEPVTGYYAAVRAPAPTGGFSLGTGARLQNPDGSHVSDPYLILQLSAEPYRHNWAAIPDIQAAYQTVKDAVLRSDLTGAQEAMATFRRIAMFSPDLLPDDATRLHDLIQKQVAQAFPATGTAGLRTPPTFPDLADIPLYSTDPP